MSSGPGRSPSDTGPPELRLDVTCPGTLAAASRRNDVLPEVVAEAFARGEPRQSDTPFAEAWPLEAWPSVPTRVLAGRYDRLFPLEFMRGLALECLGIAPDVIDTGHLPALSRPDELARRSLCDRH